MDDHHMIDLLCQEWRYRCAIIDQAFAHNYATSAFMEADNFAGWLNGFRDACFAARLHEAAKTAHQAQQLFVYRKHQAMLTRWDWEGEANG